MMRLLSVPQAVPGPEGRLLSANPSWRLIVIDVNSDTNQHPSVLSATRWFPAQVVVLTWSNTQSNFLYLVAFTD